MSDFLPPLVAEIRANAAQFFAETKKVQANVDKMAAKSDAGLTPMKKGFSTLAGVGKAAAIGIAASAAVVGFESVKMASTFQSKVELLHTAGGEAQSALKGVAAGIEHIATATGTSVNSLADGMYIAEKAGYSLANGGLKVLQAAAEGAKAENVDLATSTNALTSVMMSYHMSAAQAVSVENMLVAGSGKAKTTMQDYAGSLSTVIPIASAAHVSFQQVAGAIATLTQHGTSAQEATQELANTIRNLQAPSQVAQKAMQQIGINVNDLSTGLGRRGLTGTIALIENKMASVSHDGMIVVNAFKQSASATADLKGEIAKMPPQLARLSRGFEDGSVSYKTYYTSAKAVGGQNFELAKGFIKTMGAAKGFNDLLTSGQPAQRTAAAELKDIMGGATGLNTALMLGGENMKFFKSATQDVADAGRKAGSNISTWAATQKTLKVQLDKDGAALQVLGVKIGTWLIPKVTGLIHAISDVVGWFSRHKTVALMLAGVVGGALLLAVGAYTVSMISAAAATVAATWPILAVIAAVAAVVAGIVYLATHWHQVWNDIKQWTGDAVGWVKNHLFIIMGIPIVGWIINLAVHWHQVWDDIKTVISGAWNDVIKPVFGFIKTVAIDPLKAALHMFETVWRDTFRIIRDIINGAWNDVIKPVFRFIKTVAIDPIESAVRGFKTAWSDVWNGIGDAISDVWNNVIQPVVNAIEDAVSGVESAVSTVSHAASSVNNFVHKGGDWNPLNWDVGGPVPGPVGRPVFGVVHGGEFVLAHDMLTGQSPIPPDIVNAVLHNVNKGVPSSKGTPAAALPAASLSPPAPPAGAGQGPTQVTVVNVQGSVVDNEGLWMAVQKAGLQHGTVNSQTWAPFVRR